MNDLQYITITKSLITEKYICTQPMSYDFYLLYLLFTQTCAPTSLTSYKNSSDTMIPSHHFKKNSGIDFWKNSSAKCLATSQLFMHKNNGYIELFANYDLKNTDDLTLPKSPKFIMTAKNFMNFMVQKSQLKKQQPEQFYIVIDKQGHAHLTTNLQALTKVSFLSMLSKKLTGLFIRPVK